MMLGVRSSRAQALGLVRRRANHSGALPLAGRRLEAVTRKPDGKADSGDVPPTTAGRCLLRPFSQDPRGFRAHDGGEQQGDAEVAVPIRAMGSLLRRLWHPRPRGRELPRQCRSLVQEHLQRAQYQMELAMRGSYKPKAMMDRGAARHTVLI